MLTAKRQAPFNAVEVRASIAEFIEGVESVAVTTTDRHEPKAPALHVVVILSPERTLDIFALKHLVVALGTNRVEVSASPKFELYSDDEGSAVARLRIEIAW